MGGRGSGSGMAGGGGGTTVAASAPTSSTSASVSVTASAISAFKPKSADKGSFQIETVEGGTSTLTGYIDSVNRIGYHQTGSSKWTAYDLVTGRSFATTLPGGIGGIIKQAAKKVDRLKELRNGH